MSGISHECYTSTCEPVLQKPPDIGWRMTMPGVVAPPGRSLFPTLHVSNDGAGRSARPVTLVVRGSQLSDAQAVLLNEVLGQLPTLMGEVLAERNERARALMVHTFTQPPCVIDRFRAEARALAAWQQAVMASLPCVEMAEAAQRCSGTPWYAEEHLFWLAYRGRRCFPLCQFTAAGPPNPVWVTLVEQASRVADCREWELLAWLLTPHPILPEDQTPLAMIDQDPKQVIQLAGLTLKECRS